MDYRGAAAAANAAYLDIVAAAARAGVTIEPAAPHSADGRRLSPAPVKGRRDPRVEVSRR
jgi:hypothetical protein